MHRYYTFSASAVLLAAGGITFLPAPAFGQSLPQAEGRGVAEIIVTAQRRAENLQAVPIAITALSGEALAAHGGTPDLQSISEMTPSLSVSLYPNSSDTVVLNMRGQGAANVGQITKDGGVGLYVDGFYIARPQAALFDLGDPERVEVLRGPQGTLYGRNTTGGAVNIISKKPTGEWGGSASFSYGSRHRVHGLATLNLPEVANFSVKGAILYSRQDGYVKNEGPNADYHAMAQLAGRVAVRWAPSPDFTVDYVFDRGRVESTPPYYINPDLVGIIPGYTGSKSHTYRALSLKESKSLFTDHQLTVSWDVSDTLTLRSLTGYRKLNAHQQNNFGVALSFPFPGGDLTTFQNHDYYSRTISQEFQIIGEIGRHVDYTGGLYYFNEKASHFGVQTLGGNLVGGMPIETSKLVDAKTISKAAYLQVKYTPPLLGERLSLTLAGRYTDDRKRASRSQWFFANQFEFAARNNQTFHNFSPSANLGMQWTPDLMTYVRYSRGYKAGGSAEDGLDFAATYGPEKVEAWEVGLKSRFFNQRLTFNVSLFYNRFKDMQIDFAVDPIDLSHVATVNAGRAAIKGAEIELVARPVEPLTLGVSYAYLDPDLKTVLAPVGTTFDPALNPFAPSRVGADVTPYFTIPFVPKHALAVSGDLRFIDNGRETLTLRASWSWRAAFFTNAAAGPIVPGRDFYKNEASSRANLRLTWEQPVGVANTSFSLFANNLFNHRSREFVIGIGSQVATPAGPSGYISQTAPYSEPRVFGGEFRVRF